MTELRKVALILFGLGGHVFHFTDDPNSTLSGYDSPESLLKYNVKDYDGRYQLEGAVVIDKRACMSVAKCYASPLVSTGLKPGEIDRFDMANITGSLMCTAMMEDPGNEFGTILKGAELAGISSLDSVAVDVYTAWWKDAGARIGRFEDGGISWD